MYMSRLLLEELPSIPCLIRRAVSRVIPLTEPYVNGSQLDHHFSINFGNYHTNLNTFFSRGSQVSRHSTRTTFATVGAIPTNALRLRRKQSFCTSFQCVFACAPARTQIHIENLYSNLWSPQ